MMRVLWQGVLIFWAWVPLGHAEQMRLAVTTSFHNSGLSEILLPAIQSDLGLEVQLLVVGTGQALRLGRSGDVDAILVHSPVAEEEFVSAGYGTHRREIMYNDFVIVGPSSDPAGVAQAKNAVDGLHAIAGSQTPFVSRGDDSGTHRKELALWGQAGLDPSGFGAWYRAVGSGMGAALNTAAGMNTYLISDRASWLAFGNKGELAVLFAGDPALFNQYALIPVNPKLHGFVRHDLATALEGWLVSEQAEALINSYRVNGEKLFNFNAKDVR